MEILHQLKCRYVFVKSYCLILTFPSNLILVLIDVVCVLNISYLIELHNVSISIISLTLIVMLKTFYLLCLKFF